MTYQHDIFISYRRTSTARKWVLQYFRPQLESRLDEVSPSNVRIFCDEDMKEGVNLPAELKNRIRHSALLLAVWSASYFRSGWCMAEWTSFLRRERMLGLFTEARPMGLVYPIRYADGDHFHADARLSLCRKDFSLLNYTSDAFPSSPKFLDFEDLVRQVASDLAERLPTVPAWQPDFPILEPQPMPQATLTLPRI